MASTVALVYESSLHALTGMLGHYLPMFTAFLTHIPLYFIAVFSGLADVDAITQEMAELSGGDSLTSLAATTAILIALVTNTTVKIGIAKKF